MKSIGIVGTAKNTGKTTTLSYLINNIKSKKICLTGIGYDGEEIDNITSLPKPRLYLSEQTTVLTSEACLQNTLAETIIEERCGVYTPLGEVLKVRITKPGMLVVAGPNKLDDLQKLLKKYSNEFDTIFIDGSLNRLAPLYATDEIIFTTGASRNIDANILANEMKAIEQIFSIKKKLKTGNNIFSFDSLIDREDLDQVISKIKKGETSFRIRKMIGKEFLQNLSEFLLKNTDIHINLMLPSPISLLISGTPERIVSVIQSSENLSISFNKPIKLLAVTVNPFYPKFEGNTYKKDFIDKEHLLNTIKEKLDVPVYNIADEPAEIIDLIT